MRTTKKHFMTLKSLVRSSLVVMVLSPFILFFKLIYLFTFREREREGEREGEKYQCGDVSHTSPTGDLAHNPRMCPDWESNQLPFGLQAGAQSTESHQRGPKFSN